MIVRREDGPLLAVIASLIVGVFGGYGPPLYNVKEWHLEWFWRLCPGVSLTHPILWTHTTIVGVAQQADWVVNQTEYSFGIPRHFSTNISQEWIIFTT